MRNGIAILGTILVVVSYSVAQDTPPKAMKICVAQIGGAEAKNWNLRVPIMNRMSGEIERRQLNATVMPLETDEKHSAKQASGQQCEIVIYSVMERQSNEVNSSMEPSPNLRASVNLNAPSPDSKVRYSFKIKEVSGKQLASGKAEVELKRSFTRSDYEESGREIVEQVAEKIVSAIPKQ